MKSEAKTFRSQTVSLPEKSPLSTVRVKRERIFHSLLRWQQREKSLPWSKRAKRNMKVKRHNRPRIGHKTLSEPEGTVGNRPSSFQGKDLVLISSASSRATHYTLEISHLFSLARISAGLRLRPLAGTPLAADIFPRLILPFHSKMQKNEKLKRHCVPSLSKLFSTCSATPLR